MTLPLPVGDGVPESPPLGVLGIEGELETLTVTVTVTVELLATESVTVGVADSVGLALVVVEAHPEAVAVRDASAVVEGEPELVTVWHALAVAVPLPVPQAESVAGGVHVPVGDDVALKLALPLREGSSDVEGEIDAELQSEALSVGVKVPLGQGVEEREASVVELTVLDSETVELTEGLSVDLIVKVYVGEVVGEAVEEGEAVTDTDGVPVREDRADPLLAADAVRVTLTVTDTVEVTQVDTDLV